MLSKRMTQKNRIQSAFNLFLTGSKCYFTANLAPTAAATTATATRNPTGRVTFASGSTRSNPS